jgi:hypothetical protein
MSRLKPGLPSSDEIAPGDLCPHREHSCTSPDGQVPRYASSGACVQCCAALTEGRLELNVQNIHEEFRGRFMEFWALVDIGSPSDCWPWKGRQPSVGSPVISFFRGAGSTPRNYSVARVACCYTWGDIGLLPLRHTCGNNRCCNPLHLRILQVPHFHHRQRLRAVRLFPQVEVLGDQIRVYLDALQTNRPKRLKRLMESAPGWIRPAELGADPLTGRN